MFGTVTGSANTCVVLILFTHSLNHPWPIATQSDHYDGVRLISERYGEVATLDMPQTKIRQNKGDGPPWVAVTTRPTPKIEKGATELMRIAVALAGELHILTISRASASV